MRPRFRFEVVGEKEDSSLRAVLRKVSMPGRTSLSFQTEPSFLAAEGAGNMESQVIAVRDTYTDGIVAMGSRCFRLMFVDGEIQLGGYLHGLRGLPEVRGGTLLARGYRFLRQLHGDGRVPYYVTTILDDNEYAKGLLTSRRAGLPVYEPRGHLKVFLLPLYRRTHSGRRPSSRVVRGMHSHLLSAALESVNAFNRRHQFGPYYTPDDFERKTTLLPHFDPDALYMYQKGSEITGTLGIWDQTAFKQWVVTRYSWPYRLAAPFSPLGALLGLIPKLPGVGTPIQLLYASFLTCIPGDEETLEDILEVVVGDWSQLGYTFLAVGVHERSPLCNLFGTLAQETLSSAIYLVYWPELLSCPLPSQHLVPHLEIATL